MASMAAETLDKILWITGNVDRKGSETLTGSLEAYVRKMGEVDPVVDMSSVGYFSTSAAKALIMVAQDVQARKQKLIVRASPQVTQTLTMLGASSWLQIETCPKPNPKPDTNGSGDGGEDLGGGEMDLELPPEAMSLELPPDHSAQPTGGPSIAKEADSYAPTVHIKPNVGKRKVGNTIIAGKPAGAGSTVLGGKGLGDDKEKTPEDEAMERAHQREGQPLVDEDEDLPDDLEILRRLRVLKTYTFHFGSDDLTAKAIERTVGPWIMVDARGTKRLLNLRLVNYVDIL